MRQSRGHRSKRLASLPYENAQSGTRAIHEIEKTLEAVGASAFGYEEDWDKGEVRVRFVLRGRGWHRSQPAHLWLSRHPYSSRMRITRTEYERRAFQQGQTAAYSVLRDCIKGLVTAIATGAIPFEAAIRRSAGLPSGETVLERIEQANVLSLPPPVAAH
jgi:hypothetical protein